MKKFLRSITINSAFAPTHRGIFDIQTLYVISIACDHLTDPLLFRAIFLTAFFLFFRMSNIATHSKKSFDPTRHLLMQDLIFSPPGLHIIIKWTKTLQDHRADHIVQLPSIDNIYLCPVRAVKILLASRPLPPPDPFLQFLTTHIIKSLTLTSEMLLNKFLSTWQYKLQVMDFTHSEDQGLLFASTKMSHCKI